MRRNQEKDGPPLAFEPRETAAPYRIWGEDLEPDAVRQLQNTCRLPPVDRCDPIRQRFS